uniref:phospholipase D-like domain-containing protein n=1 Tax=Tateyamaria sp. syn59 TaxID=2576942 RepID=UPI001CB9594B
PVAEGGTHIYVHAKVVIMDDRLLRVGSSNLNNRSMGFDTECDLSIEAEDDDDPELRASIVGLRNDLLAEHLGVSNDVVEKTLLENGGSLVQTIDGLKGEGRSFISFEPPEFGDLEEEVLGENELFDPESVSNSWTG